MDEHCCVMDGLNQTLLGSKDYLLSYNISSMLCMFGMRLNIHSLLMIVDASLATHD